MGGSSGGPGIWLGRGHGKKMTMNSPIVGVSLWDFVVFVEAIVIVVVGCCWLCVVGGVVVDRLDAYSSDDDFV